MMTARDIAEAPAVVERYRRMGLVTVRPDIEPKVLLEKQPPPLPPKRPKQTPEQRRIASRDCKRRQRGSKPFKPSGKTPEQRREQVRICMRRLRAERRGQDLKAFPPRKRLRKIHRRTVPVPQAMRLMVSALSRIAFYPDWLDRAGMVQCASQALRDVGAWRNRPQTQKPPERQSTPGVRD